ncbi:MAG: ABC transporter substrate-binding protein [Desulfocapsaceae bacterium]|nr:ABC transporter substrate-binding protein [Desulfocapsaceae bacterium]
MITRKPNVNHIFSYILIIFFLLLSSSCSSDENIKVAILTEMTGRAADIGIAGRDGALLAVEELNARGGVNGREVELLIRNIALGKEEIQQTVAELAELKVTAVIGPMTSAIGLVVVPEINRYQLPTISPTVSTGLLAEQDDFFFRIIPVSSSAAEKTAEYAYQQKGLRHLLVVYDKGNNGYTEPLYKALKSKFESFDQGKVTGVGYISANGFDFLALARTVVAHEMDGLVILASSMDTALFCQQLAKLNIQKPIFSCEWALTDEIVEFGGKTVEGIEIFHSFDLNSKAESYQEFSLNFRKRFGYPADFASAYGFNAMSVILQAMNNNTSPTPQELKASILSGSPYKGVQSEIRFDEYGDAERKHILQTIRNGRIVTI